MEPGHPHSDCKTCEEQDRSRLNRPVEPVGLDDPRAWGFDRVCATLAAVDLETGKIREHTYLGMQVLCPASGRRPTPQPGPEAQPVKLVSLRKSPLHMIQRKQRHDEWIRARAAARARAMSELSNTAMEE